ncbi:diguanylate cyclase (GGDEF) domain-containing protein [Modicisalibacter ilicicola DSM 19980]|uniref:diguanylate cyclase n=1 Tax=Modicisalibacter ilicicola DSM 19980 TaxID=1121942 RepID=A0A1M5D6S4_9GAMM|nr:GGDEF domain-containing protein [Halomonas ilicicola]SHF62723.1 diguanylate cyclase (GGDEF) domain-containing protein [Halomonas ilicicola DSM 19980]
MGFLPTRLLFHRYILPALICQLVVSGLLLWWHARAYLVPDGAFLSASMLALLSSLGALFLTLLVVLVILLQRYFLHRVHLLVDYVKHQQQGPVRTPPTELFENADDITVLTEEIHRLLETLCSQNVLLRVQSLIDPLTGLGNRRLLDQRLEMTLPISRRRLTPLSMLMIDVDYFKQYNDHYGHAAGDSCLVEIANVLRDTFRRETDIVIRHGGEEFLVVLLDADKAVAMDLAEAMRSMLQAVGIRHPASPISPVVTVSIGVATAEAGTQIDTETLIACADAALYRCKDQGRNRVLCCEMNPEMRDNLDSMLH